MVPGQQRWVQIIVMLRDVDLSFQFHLGAQLGNLPACDTHFLIYEGMMKGVVIYW